MKGPVGFFDSGVGGLTVLRAVHELMPWLSTAYLGDNARAPYGPRPQEEIHRFALEGTRYLFAQGCPLVIFACNTASASALRWIQQEVLPREFPDRRVLGVVRPGAEGLPVWTRTGHVGVFGTQATIASHAYARELASLPAAPSRVTEIACPTLAGLIERGQEHGEAAQQEIAAACAAMRAADPEIDVVLLACTHFAFVVDAFLRALPGVTFITQEGLTAGSLKHYLQAHREMLARIDQTGSRAYDTTGPAADVSALASRFLGSPVTFSHVTLP